MSVQLKCVSVEDDLKDSFTLGNTYTASYSNDGYGYYAKDDNGESWYISADDESFEEVN